MKNLILITLMMILSSACRIELFPSINFDGNYISEDKKIEFSIIANTLHYNDSTLCYLISVVDFNGRKSYIVNDCPISFIKNGKDVASLSFCGVNYNNKAVRKR